MNCQLEDNSSTTERLLEAVKKGNKKDVQHLLDNHKIDINKNQIYLKFAINYRRNEIIKILLDNGASVDPDIFPDFVTENRDVIKLLLNSDINLESRDSTGTTYLHLAVKNQLTDIVDLLIEKGANVNATIMPSQISVMQIAFQENNIAIINRLLQCDINVRQRDSRKETILHYAVIHGNIEFIKTIIDKGADVNAANILEQTPLHLAVLKNNIDITKLLIEHGSKVNSKTIEKRCPLHLAADIECIEIAEFLLENGAKINEYTGYGITPLHTAVNAGNLDMVILFIRYKANVNAIGLRDETPLNIAIAYEHEKIAKYLIDNGAVVNHGSNEDMLLHMAVINKNKNLVDLLLSSGADVTVKYKDGTTALHLAVHFECPEIAELLIKKGADVDEQNKLGESALHIVVHCGDDEMYRIIPKTHSNINLKNIYGQTPLYMAARRGSVDIVIDLLKYNPDRDENKLVLYYAVKGRSEKHKEVISYLLEHGYSINFVKKNNFYEFFDFIMDSVCNGHLVIVQYLLKLGLDPNIQLPYIGINTNYVSLLHMAVKNNDREISSLLVKSGANVNAVDEFNKTPIYYAVENEDFIITELLLNNGASVDNDSKLFLIVINKGNQLIIKEFLKYYQNVNAEDEFGTTALHFAAWNEDEESIQLLLDKGAKHSPVEKLPKIRFTSETEFSICDYYGSEMLEYFRKNVVTTPLHVAARKNNSDIVEALLEHGFPADCRDGCGRTALHIAILFDCSCMDILIDLHPYLLYCVDESGFTSLDYVCNREQVSHSCFLDKVFMFIHQAKQVGENKRSMRPDFTANELVKYYVRLSSMSKIDNKKFVCHYEHLQEHYENCETEIEVLKKKTILNNVTFYDVLTKSTSTIALYMKNKNFFEAEIEKNEFPIYIRILVKRLRRAKERRILLDEAQPYFTDVLCLPELIAYQIMSYLFNRDLRCIKEVYESFMNDSENKSEFKFKAS